MSPFGRPLESACYAARAGEAETGTAGEQPDRGIAGRNAAADDEMERGPPDTFCYLGPWADRREAARLRPRVWF